MQSSVVISLVDPLLPLIVGLVGGPAAWIIRILYNRKDKKTDRFSNGGTYNRNDDDYYSNSGKSTSSDNEVPDDEN